MVTAIQPDMVIRSSLGDPIAVVEVRNRRDLTPLIAREIRHHLLAHTSHADQTGARYFLLLSQDRGYIWDCRISAHRDAPPVAEFSMLDVIDRYLPERPPEHRLRNSELEFLVLRWLIDLTLGLQDESLAANQALADAGVLDAVGGGSVVSESVA